MYINQQIYEIAHIIIEAFRKDKSLRLSRTDVTHNSSAGITWLIERSSLTNSSRRRHFQLSA